MIRASLSRLTGFSKDETGSAVVPFALWSPVLIGLILSTVELGTVTVRHTVLERSLDVAVRDVRLGNTSDHAGLKQTICDQAGALPDCMERLHLELLPLDMWAYTAPSRTADCVDTTEQVTPNRNFTHGGSNEMMLVRACYKYRPITPAGTLSSSLAKDENGYTALVATSAFVNEPQS